MTMLITFEKCGRGDRAAGVQRRVDCGPHDSYKLGKAIDTAARKFLASRDVDVYLDDDNTEFRVVVGGFRVVGHGTIRPAEAGGPRG